MTTPIRVLLADDHAVVRAGLSALMEPERDVCVVGEAGTAHETVMRAEETNADVVLLDIAMPGGGLTAMRALRSGEPSPRIVILSMHGDVAHLRAALRLGASAYVAKASGDPVVIRAIREAYHGRVYIDPALSDAVAGHIVNGSDVAGEPASELTPRMEQVLRLAAWGYTNNQIGSILGLSPKTVEVHRASLMSSLGFSGRADLVRYAHLAGLLSQPPDLPDDVSEH